MNECLVALTILPTLTNDTGYVCPHFVISLCFSLNLVIAIYISFPIRLLCLAWKSWGKIPVLVVTFLFYLILIAKKQFSSIWHRITLVEVGFKHLTLFQKIQNDSSHTSFLFIADSSMKDKILFFCILNPSKICVWCRIVYFSTISFICDTISRNIIVLFVLFTKSTTL